MLVDFCVDYIPVFGSSCGFLTHASSFFPSVKARSEHEYVMRLLNTAIIR